MKNRFGRAFARHSIAVAVCGLLLVPTAAFAAFGDRPLKTGASGHDVRVLQSWLSKLGFRTSIDGTFGRNTRWNMRRWEQKEGLNIDGRLSTSDAALLRKRMEARFPARKTTEVTPGGKARMASDGLHAVAPADAPAEVQEAIAAANEIVGKPYKYGGGHGSFRDSGYDCSGTVSYALHGAGLLSRPMDSSELAGYGSRGRGSWITVFGNSGHAYAIIAGLRLDTSGSGGRGPRWHTDLRSSDGYSVRHPNGL
jgi:cell wall-associated NlpC family hydrolase